MAKTQYKLTQELHYGTLTLLTETAAFVDLFQSDYAYPNRVEGLREINIKNIGKVSIELNFKINAWTDGSPDTDGSAVFLRYILAAGESMYIPNQKCIGYSEGAGSAADGFILNNKNPADINSGYLLQSSGSTLGADLEDSDTTVTVNASTHPFYVGDLIQVGLDTSTTTRQEIMRVTAISGATLTVERALYGTSLADKDAQTNGTNGAVNGATINLPFFNTTGNTNHYNGFSTAQTDGLGRFHIYNFFGYGRYTNNVAGGIVPGSISGKYFNSGYQELGLSNITSSSNSGLAVSTEYGFDITCNGSGLLTSDYMKFTTDSSSVLFGGTNGIISKIQSALDTQYYTTSSAVFEERVTVGIVGGDIRFTSGSRLSTSAILLAAPSAGETTPFGVGRFPAIGSVEAPVSSILPQDATMDKVTGKESRNESIFFYDDGNGNIRGNSTTGTINYITGEFSINGIPNANFVISANYGSALSGGTKASSAGSQNAISKIGARSINHKIDGLVEFTAYE